MDMDSAITMVEQMMDEWYPEPGSKQIKREYFLVQSYQNWAVKELLDYMYLNRDRKVAFNVVEEFRDMVGYYGSKAKDDIDFLIFSSAFDVATMILDVIRCF